MFFKTSCTKEEQATERGLFGFKTSDSFNFIRNFRSVFVSGSDPAPYIFRSFRV